MQSVNVCKKMYHLLQRVYTAIPEEATYISFLLLVIAQGWNIGRIGTGHGITVAE